MNTTTQKKTGISRRRSERVSCAIHVRWRRAPVAVDLVARDVNQHGMFLATPATTVPNSLMHLEVTLPTGPITVFAVARFVGDTESGHGIGIELFLLDEIARRAWNANYRALALDARRKQAQPLHSNAVAR